MKFEELVKKRKTSYEFIEKEISPTNLNKILEAGRLAPSFMNLQSWKFLIIKDEKIISKLMDTAYYGVFHSNPKIIIIPIVDCRLCFGRRLKASKGKVGLDEAVKSLSMGAMSMTLQATELGIASAIITPKEKSVKNILKMDNKDHAILIIAFGYEKKGSYKKIKKIKNLKDIAYYNTLTKK